MCSYLYFHQLHIIIPHYIKCILPFSMVSSPANIIKKYLSVLSLLSSQLPKNIKIIKVYRISIT
jgi:hypothetical protein